jgi:hypothetical protein
LQRRQRGKIHSRPKSLLLIDQQFSAHGAFHVKFQEGNLALVSDFDSFFSPSLHKWQYILVIWVKSAFHGIKASYVK